MKCHVLLQTLRGRLIYFFDLQQMYIVAFCVFLPFCILSAQSSIVSVDEVHFDSKGVTLVGDIYLPESPRAALVIVHGSGQTVRSSEFAMLLADHGFAVLTYDKRGVGASGGDYAGPEVGTNNIDSTNIQLLAHDARAAAELLQESIGELPLGLIGFSQAGWIMPVAAAQSDMVDFMVLFSCPTITTLEQLRFQFYTDGDVHFWETHSDQEARAHVYHDPDRYDFVTTDPKKSLLELDIPALWIFGQRDIQIPVGLCIDQLHELKMRGKPFDYLLFPLLAHNTAFAETIMPVELAIQWIADRVLSSEH